MAVVVVGLCMLAVVLGQQVPIQPQHVDLAEPIRLNFSSAAPHLFHSTFSLLQQVPNTVFPNGHTIASLVVPQYTLLYHARRDAETPASPEWVAFDSDMSYGIMGGHRNVWMWSFQTTRPIKALYFDGESGNLQGLGQFDTQMLMLYGNATGPDDQDDLELEYVRARGLCNWLEDAGLRGKDWGFEGIVRMNAGFEMILCDFESDAMKLVSRINVTAPQLPESVAIEESAADDPNWRDILRREPFLRTRSWNWFNSATWHYGSSGMGFNKGETRARLYSCGALSFYSRQFANQSLNRALEERQRLNLTDAGLWKGHENRDAALTELRRRRRYHHLEHANQKEAKLMKGNVENAIKGLLDKDCAGPDWMLMAGEIIQRMAKHLKDFEEALYSLDLANAKSWLDGVRGMSHMFMVNYLQYPSTQDLSVWSVHSGLFNETYSLCRHRYTSLFDENSMSLEDAEQLWALEETFGTICLVELAVGFDIEKTWSGGHHQDLSKRSRLWGDQIAELRAWLGWESEYLACKEACAADERCYIPMWPITRPGASDEGEHRRQIGAQRRPWVHADETDLWEPKCVRDVCIEGLCWVS
jgi:hypothetical protein